MALSRPLTKELLKKMFLKALAEFRPGGKFPNHAHGSDNVIHLMPHVFGITPLDAEERMLVARAVYELERDGFLWQDITQSSFHKILSPTGRQAVQNDLKNMKLPSVDIDQVISREDLRSRVRDDFLSGDYETAVFKAFRFVEEHVRAKANEPASSLGVGLMSAAFSPSNGKLKHPGAAVPQEQDGLHQLMRGAIAWFKNPSSHRTVSRNDPQEAAHVLAFANMLLDLVDQCN
jgi:uncharacterized protein (TIGR02391 family)